MNDRAERMVQGWIPNQHTFAENLAEALRIAEWMHNWYVGHKPYDLDLGIQSSALPVLLAALAASVAEPDDTVQEIGAFEYRHKPKCPKGINCKCGLSKLLRKLNTEYEHAARAVAEKAPAPPSGLLAAAKKIYNFIDSGVLVRDVSRDHVEGWAIKQLPLVLALKEFQDAIMAAEKAAPAAPPHERR